MAGDAGYKILLSQVLSMPDIATLPAMENTENIKGDQDRRYSEPVQPLPRREYDLWLQDASIGAHQM